MFTKEELSPYALDVLSKVKAQLPEKIAQRLRSNRCFTTHGSYRTLFLFDVWDCNQTDVLDRKHFKYCLGYDRRPGATHDGYLHLWINRIRIYRERTEIVAELDQQLPTVVPTGFTWHPSDRAFNIGLDFNYPTDPSRLSEVLVSRYVALISAVHPILMPIVDRFTTPLGEGERRAIVARRGRSQFTAVGVFNSQRIREYTRSIPPSWRKAILEKFNHRCGKCGADLKKSGHHIDHILAFSNGGTTTRDNLQPLCPTCNLKKGKR